MYPCRNDPSMMLSVIVGFVVKGLPFQMLPLMETPMAVGWVWIRLFFTSGLVPAFSIAYP